MKKRFKTLFMALLLACGGAGYSQHVQYPATEIITVPRWEGSGIPDGWTPPTSTRIIERGAMPFSESQSIPDKFEGRQSDVDDVSTYNPETNASGNRVTQGAIVSVGRHFIANNLANFTPCDNAMAISDSGFIVSADNFTVEYYDETPDTLLQHQTYNLFYADTALTRIPFDPRVIYDAYDDRFILITLAYKDSMPNFLLVSISKGQDPRNGWNHYRINSDTLDINQWLDFANIAVNKEEIFISGNMFTDASDVFSGVKVFQIRKREALTGQPLSYRVWPDVLDDDGNLAYTLVPLSDGLMSQGYSRGIYLVSTKLVSGVQSSTKLYWYQITDSMNAPGVSIVTNQSASSIAYSPQNQALQLGNPDHIKISDCKVQSGYYLDSTLNFVYTKNTNGFSTIALHRLDIRTNTNARYAWGFSTGSQDYCFPSIAFWGEDSTDSDNILMTFQRTGTGIFPELAVVNYQGGAFAPSATLVRIGNGFIDLTNGLERWGDYTTTQRRYSGMQKSCWIAGSYPNGATPNFYGIANGLNTYVAEILDSVLVGIDAISMKHRSMTVFPNPTSRKVTINLDGENLAEMATSVSILNFAGKTILEREFSPCSSFGMDFDEFAKGAYLLKVTLKNGKYETRKVVVY